MMTVFAAKSDLEKITLIENSSFSCPWSPEFFDKVIQISESDGYIKVICEKENDEILGYAVIEVIPPESELMDIAVSESFRKQGIGRILLNAAIREAFRMGGKKMYLEVRESNEPARSLYEKSGFCQIGIRKNYYNKPVENAVLMLSEITGNSEN